MENRRSILHKAIACLSLIALLVMGHSTVRAQSSGPVGVVNAFYTWYLGTHGDWTNLSGARAYLTPSLYRSLDTAATVQRKAHAAIMDIDPFNGAQAEAASYAAGTPSGNGTRATVPVRIKLSGGNGSSMVQVVTVHSSAGWKIDNFVYPGTGDLRHTLAAALK